jgi:hypothetical protein
MASLAASIASIPFFIWRTQGLAAYSIKSAFFVVVYLAAGSLLMREEARAWLLEARRIARRLRSNYRDGEPTPELRR